MFCIVCKSETRKYKCPKCFEYYCSLQCFKSHNNSDDCNKNEHNKKPKVVTESVTHLPFKTEDTVDIAILEKLGESQNLKTLLENPHLRNYLFEIDKAPGSWKAMKIAMQEPLFIEFADECLKVIEPQSNKN